ncbi:MAG TPA: hypothetical protein PKY10_11895 [Lentisphaeria bacterium]|nr:hypothetical protein [Lentisphaeria bacterium]
MSAILFRHRFRLVLLTSLLLVAAATDALAQRNRTEGSISKLKCYNERTPSFPASIQGNKGSRDDWCRIDLEFETKTGPNEGWIDEIEVKWAVLAEVSTEKRAIFMTLSTFYTDVEDGKHNACVYIKPKFFKRHLKSNRPVLNRLSLYAEILVDGQVVARQEVKSSNRVPNNWFRHPGGLTNELLPKRLTPFAHFDYDYYEHEKVTP